MKRVIGLMPIAVVRPHPCQGGSRTLCLPNLPCMKDPSQRAGNGGGGTCQKPMLRRSATNVAPAPGHSGISVSCRSVSLGVVVERGVFFSRAFVSVADLVALVAISGAMTVGELVDSGWVPHWGSVEHAICVGIV